MSQDEEMRELETRLMLDPYDSEAAQRLRAMRDRLGYTLGPSVFQKVFDVLCRMDEIKDLKSELWRR